MYNINLGNNKIKYLIASSCIFAALLVVIVLSILMLPTIKTKNKADTFTLSERIEYETSRSEGTTYYSPIYYFIADGKEYSCYTNSKQSYKPTEEPTKIFYNSKNPTECVSETEYNLSLILLYVAAPIVAIVDLLIAFFLIVPPIIKSRKIKKLIEFGQLIKNVPCKIIPSNISLNGVAGYKIEIKYETNNGDTLCLKSDIKFNQNHIDKNTADLLIDPMNIKNYFIDFDIT